MGQCSGTLLAILLVLASPAPVRAQAEPAHVPAAAADGPVSHRALAGQLFVPSHLVQDPFSCTSVWLFWGVGGGEAIGPTLDLGPLVPFLPLGLSGVHSVLWPLGGALATTQNFGLGVYDTGVPELAAGIEIDWWLGRLASQQVASFTSAWVNLRYYGNGT
jgi:hypothetical protein